MLVNGVEVTGGGGGSANLAQYPTLADFPVTGDDQTLYIAQDTGILYRWDSTASAYAAAGFDDAPSDGNVYVRQDGQWVLDLGSSIRLPDAHGFLDPAIIANIEATQTDYVYLVDVDSDIRFDQDEPPQLAGDQSGNILYWTSANGWRVVGRFTGERGPEGIGLRILGSLPDIPSLPMTGNEAGDSYVIDENMYVWDGSAWKKLSQIGPTGKSAYEIAILTGSITSNVSQAAWIASLKGDSAYKIAIDEGTIPPTATKTDFLDSLKGKDGRSAYQIAVAETGFVGTEFQWIASLKGEQGIQGNVGPQGEKGDMGAGIYIKGNVSAVEDLPLVPILATVT